MSVALSLSDAERYCHEMARREAKNFYWGFISLPRDQRNAIYALYDFARQVDDEADGAAHLPDLAGRLQRQRDRLTRCVRGEYDNDPVMQVLAVAIRRFSIPERELQMLVDGVEMDGKQLRYQTWDELREYCNLVASVVGRMCVRIFGFEDEAALERADDLGIALQLTNILRDVREDAGLGRVYLPQEDLRRFGVSEEMLLLTDSGTPRPQPKPSPKGEGWDALVAFEAARARDYFTRGYEVLRYIDRRPAACVRTMAGIYERILEKIERDPALPLRARAGLSSTEKIGTMVWAWLMP
ncbi:MAG TPA: squalene/phytoene synthase family protein [Candidatus Acidoferrales bacterium]|nr:squalene/phytoene synthase family protein [Candidatus Acidoferrales bacterium]